ncbi:MAG: hypothetical protein ACFFBD_05360 [Candidatus Hodarchaeota archaeon]
MEVANQKGRIAPDLTDLRQDVPIHHLFKTTSIPSRASLNRLSLKQRRKLFAEELMRQSLEPEHIQHLYMICFSRNHRDNALGALTSAFKSPNPLESAGTYYQNIIKVLPSIRHFFLSSLTYMFKHMLLGEGRTGIVIDSLEKYREVQDQFVQYFGLKPPRSARILDTILTDEPTLEKLTTHLGLFLRLEEIFGRDTPQICELRDFITSKNVICYKVAKARVKLCLNRLEGHDLSNHEARKLDMLRQKIDQITNRLDILNLYELEF